MVLSVGLRAFMFVLLWCFVLYGVLWLMVACVDLVYDVLWFCCWCLWLVVLLCCLLWTVVSLLLVCCLVVVMWFGVGFVGLLGFVVNSVGRVDSLLLDVCCLCVLLQFVFRFVRLLVVWLCVCFVTLF